VRLKPSSVIQLNLAIVTGKKDGPQTAIPLLHALENHKALENYYLLYASLGEFYEQTGEKEKARAYFRRAKDLARSSAIHELLDRKISR
jgi:RNA polymerase sigma-70 factor (ECF subfamily)